MSDADMTSPAVETADIKRPDPSLVASLYGIGSATASGGSVANGSD